MGRAVLDQRLDDQGERITAEIVDYLKTGSAESIYVEQPALVADALGEFPSVRGSGEPAVMAGRGAVGRRSQRHFAGWREYTVARRRG